MGLENRLGIWQKLESVFFLLFFFGPLFTLYAFISRCFEGDYMVRTMLEMDNTEMSKAAQVLSLKKLLL